MGGQKRGAREKAGGKAEMEGRSGGAIRRWVVVSNFAQIYFVWQVSRYICHVGLCLADLKSQNKIVYLLNATESFMSSETRGLRSFILEPLLMKNCVWENQGLVQIISTVQRSVTWRKLVYQWNSLVRQIYAYHKNILIQQFHFLEFILKKQLDKGVNPV